MKKIFFISSMLFVSSITTWAHQGPAYFEPGFHIFHKTTKSERQDNRAIKKEKELFIPSYQTGQQFSRDFPKATDVTWYTPSFEEATFKLNGQRMKAFYDYESDLIGTTTAAHYSELPETARKYIEKHYGEYKPQEVILFDDNQNNDTDMMFYGSVFDKDNYFVELQNGNKTILLQVSMAGNVIFFKDLSN